MKTLFIQAISKKKFDERVIKDLEKLPKNLVIAHSIQYEKAANEIKNKLRKTHKILKCIQVLGCSKPVLPSETEAILLIGEAKFHGVSLFYETGVKVYLLEENKIKEISKEDADTLEKKKRGALAKFLNANSVGIIICTKPGQERLDEAINLSKKIKNKKNYLFLSNSVDEKEFENFKIESWVNSACPRMDFNFAVLNIADATKLNFSNREN